jgi:hypothetical protein
VKRTLKPLLAILLLVETSTAQTPDLIDTLKGQKASEVDLSVPESPAFAALGVTSENVLRPSSPRALASSILNGVDPNGNFQTGFALDTAPYFLAYGSRLTLGAYRDRYAIRFLSRIQLSAATTQGTSENDKAVRLGVGLRLTPWDSGDYRMNKKFVEELNGLSEAADREFPNSVNPETQLKNLAAREEKIRTGLAPLREKYRKKNWNASAFSLGFAPTWISSNGTTKNLEWNGGVSWASLSYGFESVPGLEDSAQIILHGRYRNRDHVPVPDAKDQYYIQDSGLFGARARFGAVDMNGNFDLVYLWVNPQTLPNDQYLRISGGAERRIVENLWLQISVGAESGRQDNRNHLLLLTNFKWALGQKQ